MQSTSDSRQPSRSRSEHYVALAVVMFACFLRVGLWHQYSVTRLPDSGTYLGLASAILKGELLGDEGGRAPGYPLLLAMAGVVDSRVWLLQMLAGVAISLMLYYSCYRLTHSLSVSATVGMLHSLNIAQIFFEATIVSETLTTLLVTATGASLFVALDANTSRQRGRSFALIAAFLAAATALTRPQYVFLPAIVALMFLFADLSRRRSSPLRAISWAATCLAPGLIAILGWAGFNYFRHDYFTVSTYMGMNLTNHTIVLAESAPEQYAEIADSSSVIATRKLSVRGDTPWPSGRRFPN